MRPKIYKILHFVHPEFFNISKNVNHVSIKKGCDALQISIKILDNCVKSLLELLSQFSIIYKRFCYHFDRSY